MYFGTFGTFQTAPKFGSRMYKVFFPQNLVHSTAKFGSSLKCSESSEVHIRPIFGFFSSKPCTFYCQIWEQFEMFRKFRSTYQTFIWIFFLKTLYILLPNLGAV